ncbi:uncharacterized protein BDW43DRAFT_313313 [Aspergillus alliaceus]|uniref:uncharacterized protein n=1 Tax=Petromyces alliaceus TaxID=209559 RepID=UPI0012A4D3C0|nr:uncharacterized protein BDW43DRAFT_313313 [Aspergillus alliaceus]KAB8231239.1 hypothetical protein BDW43DRAFT_313313 [Aspergillus alliaceus]
MAFFAHAKTSRDEDHWRYLIVALCMEVLDEWYRTVQKRNPKAALTREAPEFYLHDDKEFKLMDSTKENKEAPEQNHRSGKSYAVLLHLLAATRNGSLKNGFYIRSKSDPRVFWYIDDDGYISASQQRRTRFKISNKDRGHEDNVIIRSDPISISPVWDRTREVSISNGGDLCLSSRGSDFTLGDLKHDFYSINYENAVRVMRERNNGEEWQLVS